MSRWTTIFASIAIIAFSVPAIAADDDLPRNIELKPGAASSDTAGQTAADTSCGTTTRQIVTEGKDAPAAEAPKEGAASEAAPAAPAPAAPAEAAPPPAKAETAPPPLAPAAPLPPAEAAIPAPPPPPPPGLKPEEVIVAVQTELKRVGCDPGAIDGDWGGRSREALAAFSHFAKVDVGKLAPTPEILELIKGKAEVVCVGPAPAPEQQAAPPAHDDYGGGGYDGGGYGGGGGGY
jgi:hypothetical protein